MNRKQYDMVDAWVKKHYGDLEREVLSNEVRYKILCKIYKKKLKEKKAQIKALKSLLKLYHVTSGDDALMGPDTGKVLPLEDGFDHLADGIKSYLRETCEECKYYKKGGDGEKDTCTKHDKFVIPTCTCFAWERKEEQDAWVRSCTLCDYCAEKHLQGMSGEVVVLWCNKKQQRIFQSSDACDKFEQRK